MIYVLDSDSAKNKSTAEKSYRKIDYGNNVHRT